MAILFLYNQLAYSKEIKIEKNLAIKYCDALDKNLFKGLDNEIILKYEYFFGDINKDEYKDKGEVLTKIVKEIYDTCSYKLNKKNTNDFSILLKKFLSSN